MFAYEEITLRKLDAQHLWLLQGVKLESWRSTHRTTIQTVEEQKRWFESLDHDVHQPSNLILVADEKNQVHFGVFKFANIDWISRSADVGWDVFPTHRGKGLGKKLVHAGCRFAFEIFNLQRLTAEILDGNVPSTRCALAAGFQKEGTKRLAVFKEGQFLDSHVYGLLAHELFREAPREE